MGDHDAVLLHQRGLVIGAVDAVRHDGGHAAAEQAVPAVALAVEFCAGAQLGDPRDLTRILGQVTLRRYVVFFCQFAETAHILVTRAGGEARRDHRAHRARVQGVFGVAGIQPAARLGQTRGGGRLTVAVRAVAVHTQLADKGGKPRAAQLVHQFERCVGVQRRKDAGACCGAVFQVAHKIGVAQPGVGRVGVVGFLGVGVLLQPVQQLQIHRRAAIAVLRRVQMQVHKTRRDDFTRIVENFHPGRGSLAESGAQAVFTQQIALADAEGVRGGGVEEGAFQGESVHIVYLFI